MAGQERARIRFTTYVQGLSKLRAYIEDGLVIGLDEDKGFGTVNAVSYYGSLNSATVMSGAPGASTPRSMEERATIVLNVRDFYGPVKNYDHKTAFNAAIDAMNSVGVRVRLEIPAGHYPLGNGELNPITASDFSIVGAGAGATRLFISTIGSKGGTIFDYSPSSATRPNACVRTELRGFYVTFDENLAPTGPLIDLDGGADHTFDDITVTGGATFMRIGNTEGVARVNLGNIFGSDWRFDLGLPAFKIHRVSNMALTRWNFVGVGGNSGFMFQIASKDFADTIFLSKGGCQATDVTHGGLQLDATNGAIYNIFVSDCVFDHTNYAALEIVQGDHHLHNISFMGCRFTADLSFPVILQRTGEGDWYGVSFTAGRMIYNSDGAVSATANDPTRMEVLLNGVQFVDAVNETTPQVWAPAALQMGCRFSSVGCQWISATDTDGRTDYPVKITADVDKFSVSGGLVQTCRYRKIDHYAYSAWSADRVVAGNSGIDENSIVPAVHPGYLSNRLYPTHSGSLITTAAFPATGRIYTYPFVVHAPVEVSALHVWVVTGAAGSSLKAAIYRNDAGRPKGAPMTAANTGVASTANNSDANIAVSNVTLSPGVYWAAWQASGGLPECSALINSTCAIEEMLGRASMGGLAATGVWIAQAFADPWPTLTGAESWADHTGEGIPMMRLMTA
jgi:hypothetical protein